MQETDHDLLIRLSEKLDAVRDSIRDLVTRALPDKADAKDMRSLERRIELLEGSELPGKADIKEVQTIEQRVKSLESITDRHGDDIVAAKSSARTIGSIVGYVSGAATLAYHLYVFLQK